jgi:cysteinyl-tRNA synthetase
MVWKPNDPNEATVAFNSENDFQIMTYSILDTIGNTPLVEIKKLNPNPRVRVLAKLEYFNPGGSIKDRAALYMIAAAEQSGELTPDKIVIEATSGNTGIGLALVCGIKGYRLLLAMSESVSIERRKILKARGAEILLTPGHLGTDGAIEEVYRLARENPERYFVVDQFNNEANWKAHYDGTAQEVWEQSNGAVSTFVACLGTTGTLMGASRKLKQLNPAVQIVGVEPYLGHKIQGLKNMKEAYCPEIFEKRRLDKIVNIDDEEAFKTARRLAKTEGLFVGMSSGAAMAVALQEAQQLTEGTVVVILPDGGERYLSTPLFAEQDDIGLKLFNTLSKRKDSFAPIVTGSVSLYSYGPTAHAKMHVAEMRRYVFADLLCRYLQFRGYRVRHIMNIADLDDRTIRGSEKAGQDPAAFADSHIEEFKQDLALLGVQAAEKYPRASEHVADMVTLSQKLLSKGFAYEKLRSLYFDISRFAEYGQLSGIDINKIKLGATVDLDEYEKQNPRDFVLFKRSKLSELKRGIFTQTEWGNVRPSWHIQCAAISMKYLGENYDIYAGSRELIFPHHENVNAIAAAATGKPLARFWIHCDRILIEGKKVDENESGYTLEALARQGYSGRLIRYWLISTHYRKPITFSEDRLNEARQSLKRIDQCVFTLQNIKGGQPYPDLDQLLYDIKNGVTRAMDDDLNISAALAVLFSNIKKINILALERKINTAGAARILDAFRRIDAVLGFLEFSQAVDDPEVRRLIKARDQARSERNWEAADKLRNQLQSRGIMVQDRKLEGTL